MTAWSCTIPILHVPIPFPKPKSQARLGCAQPRVASQKKTPRLRCGVSVLQILFGRLIVCAVHRVDSSPPSFVVLHFRIAEVVTLRLLPAKLSKQAAFASVALSRRDG